MQGDIYCACWRCKSLDILHEDDLVVWLKTHWGHYVTLKEDLGNGEYEIDHLTPVEVTGS